MPYRDEAWPAGTPCFVDVSVDDAEAARAFYSALFGWEVPDGPEEAGGYMVALMGGRAAAGVMAKPEGMEAMPSAWSTYFAVGDVDAAAAAVSAAGGTVVMEPMDVLDAGRMAFAVDPSGAAFGLWQARGSVGSEVFNEPGAYCWNELHTRDYAGSQAFYQDVFGFAFEEMPMEGMSYSTFALSPGGDAVGGVFLDGEMPEGVPPYWLVWFAVADCDAALARAEGLGSAVLMPASDSPFGRMAVVRGPQGEVFGLIDVDITVGSVPGEG